MIRPTTCHLIIHPENISSLIRRRDWQGPSYGWSALQTVGVPAVDGLYRIDQELVKIFCDLVVFQRSIHWPRGQDF